MRQRINGAKYKSRPYPFIRCVSVDARFYAASSARRVSTLATNPGTTEALRRVSALTQLVENQVADARASTTVCGNSMSAK